MEFLSSSSYLAISITIIAYLIGVTLQQKTKIPLLNPILIASLIVAVIVMTTDLNYSDYLADNAALNYLLTPATICLAIPLYKQFHLVKKHATAILISILAGIIANIIVVYGVSLLLNVDYSYYVSILPRSITTSIGVPLSEEQGGIAAITAIAISFAGIGGNIISPMLCKIFKITYPIAKGLAIGTSAHVVGTTKAIEMGEIEGAMSSLSIAVAGIMTVIVLPLFLNLPY